ncbi:phosphatidate cytidylyltransferase [Lederbergia galactosidilytica]|uniref:Phosphatidate cytidylyltransferase n=1 Tax=Lederbergia galactosidilytica TaxID=217031 RepID=A0A177ZYE9_9BACI|nr:phosphatidate cytidylyltransferase [Lederbergia galactosidilytica]KRG13451.1 phosphatidate cytidylyltransferase [Virgibacillus soli]MBP1913623.1 phosphatidate cytidylyltransferase [Lederbergia galactosidilytica]OAK72529.1 phosphatidate cytidylyltransferase [Lederbergia galactosidilytica]
MKERIITAAILIAIFIPMVIIGGIPFLLLTYVMATIALYELLQMRKLSIFSFHGALATLFLWIFLLPPHLYDKLYLFSLSKMEISFVIVLILLSYTVIVKNNFNFDQAGFSFFSIFYIGIGFYYMVQIREQGLVLLFFALLVVWMTDSGAYFVGKYLGKRKLWPEISPNKTIGGFIGGILSAILVAIVFAIFTNIPVTTVKLLIITVILSIFGQLGDLAESALKRHFAVKDSGRIFPGHGGMLDRCDSWLFVLPLLYFLLTKLP